MRYAGIGSREINKHFYKQCVEYAVRLGELGFILNSGGAPGSDSAFEEGCDSKNFPKQIHLPWEKFNDNPSPLFEVSPEAFEIGKRFHPAWHKLTEKGQLLISRNSYQILGRDLKSPVDIVVCYTPNAKISGGTAQGIKIAKHYKIPVANIASQEDVKFLNRYIDSISTWL